MVGAVCSVAQVLGNPLNDLVRLVGRVAGTSHGLVGWHILTLATCAWGCMGLHGGSHVLAMQKDLAKCVHVLTTVSPRKPVLSVPVHAACRSGMSNGDADAFCMAPLHRRCMNARTPSYLLSP